MYIVDLFCIGTCTLTIASLFDVGSIPSKPFIDPEDDDRVVARWMDVGSYIGVLCKVCVVQARQVGWIRFGALLLFLTPKPSARSIHYFETLAA